VSIPCHAIRIPSSPPADKELLLLSLCRRLCAAAPPAPQTGTTTASPIICSPHWFDSSPLHNPTSAKTVFSPCFLDTDAKRHVCMHVRSPECSTPSRPSRSPNVAESCADTTPSPTRSCPSSRVELGLIVQLRSVGVHPALELDGNMDGTPPPSFFCLAMLLVNRGRRFISQRLRVSTLQPMDLTLLNHSLMSVPQTRQSRQASCWGSSVNRNPSSKKNSVKGTMLSTYVKGFSMQQQKT
jgi:hypothetical protein